MWGAIFVLSIAAIGAFLPSALTTDADVTNEPESQQGYDAIFRHLPPSDDFVNEVVVFRAPGEDVTTSAEVRGAVDGLASDLEATGRTFSVTTYYESRDRSLVSPDRDATVLAIGMGADAEDGIKDVIDVVQQADRGPYEVDITGEFTADDDFLTLSNKDLKEGELFFGLPAALIVLLIVFGAVVAALVPLLLAIVSIVFALALVAIVGQIWEVSFFVVNMLTGMGLALGVDYALFIVSRFREERVRGEAKLDAIAVSGRTASRAVLFSGTAFVIAMTGMLLVPDTILRSLAAGAVLVGITAVLGATTLLPAVLSLLGDRVDALPHSVHRPGQRARCRLLEPRRAPRPAGAAREPPGGRTALVLLALPALDLRTGSAGVRTVPDGYAAKDGFNALEREFGVGTVDTAQVVVEGESRPADTERRRPARRPARERSRLPGARDRRWRRTGSWPWSRPRCAGTAGTRPPCRRSRGCDRSSCRRRFQARRRRSPSPARRRRSSTTARSWTTGCRSSSPSCLA